MCVWIGEQPLYASFGGTASGSLSYWVTQEGRDFKTTWMTFDYFVQGRFPGRKEMAQHSSVAQNPHLAARELRPPSPISFPRCSWGPWSCGLEEVQPRRNPSSFKVLGLKFQAVI